MDEYKLELSKRYGIKEGLETEKVSILKACEKLGIKPTKLDVQKEIVKLENDLKESLSQADKILKQSK